MRTLVAFALLSASLLAIEVRSPGNVLRVEITEAEHLQWTVLRGDRTILEPSPIGVIISDRDLGTGAQLGRNRDQIIDQDFPYRGNHAVVRRQSRLTTISMRTGETEWTLEVRVFDDAAAFRCIVPGTGKRHVAGESTAFVLPAGSHLWFQPAMHSYEARYTDKPVEDLKKGDRSGPPLTYRLADGSYAAITEACLDHYSGMTLHADGQPRTLAARFVCNAGGWDAADTVTTPWRVLMAAPDLDGLVNCEAVACLAPAPDPARYPNGIDTDWIQPGRCVWSWLGGGGVSVTNMNDYARLAAELGYEYNLVDEGWGHWKEPGRDKWDMIADVVRYGDRHGVKTWVWKASGDRRGIPGIRQREPRREFFAKCRDLGIAGVKIDFMDSESTDLVDFYNRTLEDAADFQLLIDFHGAYKPTGEARTYPNELTREGIRGLEARAPWARHNTILPFTRYLAGHGDYTPLNFGGRRGETTWAHQLASTIIFTSPFLCLGEHPQKILDNPACEWLKTLPPTYSETRVLPLSEIGKVAGFARRDLDGSWFVAVMNGTEARDVTIPASFLGDGAYFAQIFADDPAKPDAYRQTDAIWTTEQALAASLAANGGYAARFSRLQLVPHAGSFEDSIAIQVRKADPEAIVRYTLDGTTPSAASPMLGDSLTLTQSSVLRAKVMSGVGAGAETHARYTKIRPPALQILPEVRLLDLPANVTIRSGLAGAEIRYTIDGSEPTASSPRYTSPFALTKDGTVRVRLTAPALPQPLLASRSYYVLPPLPPTPQVHLSDLPWVSGKCGWGGAPKKDRSIEGHALKVAGKTYERGMGTHAESEIVYDLKPTYARFVAVVGIDQEIEATGAPSVVYQILVDGKLLAESPIVGKDEAWHFDVALPEGGKRLALRVTKGPDGINHDHADWVNAGFLTR
jgi:alpha-glucosidase